MVYSPDQYAVPPVNYAQDATEYDWRESLSDNQGFTSSPVPSYGTIYSDHNSTFTPSTAPLSTPYAGDPGFGFVGNSLNTLLNPHDFSSGHNSVHMQDLFSMSGQQRSVIAADRGTYLSDNRISWQPQTDCTAVDDNKFENSRHLQQVRATGPAYPDDTELDLDDELKDIVESLIARRTTSGTFPIRLNGLAEIARACGVHVALVAVYYGDQIHNKSTSSIVRSPSIQSVPGILSFKDLSPHKQQTGLRIIQEYVAKCYDAPCSKKSSKNPGKYLCKWPDCRFSHQKEGEWKRHVEARRPQHVYICCICLNTDSPEKAFKSFREDKFLQHVRTHNVLEKDCKRLARGFCHPVDDDHNGVCGGNGCGIQYVSWEDHWRHVASHFREGTAAPSTFMDNDGRPSSAARVPLRQAGVGKRAVSASRQQSGCSKKRKS